MSPIGVEDNPELVVDEIVGIVGKERVHTLACDPGRLRIGQRDLLGWLAVATIARTAAIPATTLLIAARGIESRQVLYELAILAGEHYDPEAKKSHKGPRGAGHKGDLPLLNASEKGGSQTVLASRLKLADVRGKALVIHEGGDTYSDQPENGGGKGRIACGVVPK